MKFQANEKGWLVAFVLALLPAALIAWGWHIVPMSNPDRPLKPDQLEPLSDAVTVAIAMCVGYLTVDRFRIHKNLKDMCHGFLKDFPKDQLLLRFREKRASNDEIAFVTLLFFAEDEDALAATVTRKKEMAQTDFFRSWRGWALRWFLRAKADRKLVIALLVLLCVFQFYIATAELRPAIVDGLSARSAWSGWMLMFSGFFYPAINWSLSDRTLQSVKKSSKSWLDSYATVLQDEVKELEPPQADPVARMTRRTRKATGS